MTDFAKALLKVPVRRVEATLLRAVAAAALFPSGEPTSPDFLFTSGKQNRFNLAGTECLYWSETEATALAEYRRQFQGLDHGAKQPSGRQLPQHESRKSDPGKLAMMARLRPGVWTFFGSKLCCGGEDCTVGIERDKTVATRGSGEH